MPDPNNPDPDPLTAPPESGIPPEADQGVDTVGVDTVEDRSAIQGAMEDALNHALASGDDGSLRTYPIPEKMRRRLVTEFTYHTPRADQIPRYGTIRALALTFATMIVELTPPSREQSLALTKIGEAVHQANAAIERGEAEDEEAAEKTAEAAKAAKAAKAE